MSGDTSARRSIRSSRAAALGTIAVAIGVGVGYYAAARLSLELSLVGHNVTPLWLPTGVAVACFVAFGTWSAPGIFVAAFLVNLPFTSTVPAVLGIALGNTAAPTLVALLLRKLKFRYQLDRLIDVIFLVFAALAATTVSASIGSALLLASDGISQSQFLSTWLVWWTGDTMGILLFAPFLWSVMVGRSTWTVTRAVGALGSYVVLVGVLILAVHSQQEDLFLAFPVLAWIAWMLQLSGAAPAALLSSVVVTIAIVHNVGPFGHLDLTEKMVGLQAFNAVVAFTTLALAAAVAERAAVSARVGRLSQRLTVLQDLTARLARISSSAEASSYVLGEAVGLLGGTSGSLCLVDGSRLALVAFAGYPDDVVSTFASFSIDATTPAGECVLSKRPIYCESLDELYERYPVFLQGPIVGDPSFAVLPLAVHDDQMLGAMVIGFHSPQHFDPERKELLEALAQEASVAIDRAQANEAAQRAQERIQFLAEAGSRLAASLDLDQTMQVVGRLAVPRLADRCALYLLNEKGDLDRFALAPSLTEDERLLFEFRPPSLQDPSGIGAVIRTGETMHLTETSEDLLEASASSEAHLALLTRVGIGGVLLMPLVARGRRIGGLALVNRKDRAMSLQDRALAEELASRAAISIDNARSFTNEAAIAEVLQLALLQSVLPEIEGVELAARYVPASPRTLVGGDWYNIVEIDDDRFAFVVGDVSGHGIGAATMMGMLRNTTRAFASLGYAPNAVLQHAAEDIYVSRDHHFATVLVGTVNKATRELQLASAGHYPPILATAGEARYLDVPAGPPLGVIEHRYEAATFTIPDRSLLIAFTDGLIERRDEPIDASLERLRALACRVDMPVQELLGDLVNANAAAFRDDDIAVVGMQWLR